MVALRERFAGVELARIMAEKRAIAKANRSTTFKLSKLGQRVASFSRREWMLLGQLYGFDKLTDPDFLKCLIRDNPDSRIKTTRGSRGQEILQAKPLPKGTIYVPRHFVK